MIYNIYFRSGSIMEVEADAISELNGIRFYTLKNQIVATVSIGDVSGTKHVGKKNNLGFSKYTETFNPGFRIY